MTFFVETSVLVFPMICDLFCETMDWATTDALMERALVNWRSIKDREPDGKPELTLSLNICKSAMTEAEEAYKLYVRGKRKPSSIHKPIPRPEEVFFNPSCKRKPSSIHKPISTTHEDLVADNQESHKAESSLGAKARELPLARRLVNAALEEELAKTCS